MGHSASKPLPELPPEVVLNIFEFLPLPKFFGLPGILGARTALTDTALVCRDWAELSQRVLFGHVELFERETIARWCATDANKWTRSLLIRLHDPLDDHATFDWLGPVLHAGLSHAQGEPEEGQPLRVVQLDLISYAAELSNEFCQVEAFKGLSSFKLRAAKFPHKLPPSTFVNLRHLDIKLFDTFDLPEGQLPCLPSLTHLTCASAFGPHLPHLATAFPNLTYLFSAEIWSDQPTFDLTTPVRELLPPLLTHFGTDSPITAEVCANLPDQLVQLTTRLKPQHVDFGAVRERWLEPTERRGEELGVLCLLRRGEGRARLGHDEMVQVGKYAAAGGTLQMMWHDEWDDARWRGLDRVKHILPRPEDWPRRQQAGLGYHFARLGVWAFGEEALQY